jgi:hypothetical protein
MGKVLLLKKKFQRRMYKLFISKNNYRLLDMNLMSNSPRFFDDLKKPIKKIIAYIHVYSLKLEYINLFSVCPKAVAVLGLWGFVDAPIRCSQKVYQKYRTYMVSEISRSCVQLSGLLSEILKKEAVSGRFHEKNVFTKCEIYYFLWQLVIKN